MSLIVIFLNQADGSFKAATAETLQLRQIDPKVAALGIVEAKPKKSEDGTPLLTPDGKPELESIYTPLINYPVVLQKVEEAPKVELATEVPPALKRTAKVRKKAN